MIWHPSRGPGGVWRSAELELDGSVLHVRNEANRLQIDLRDPAVEMTLHHYATTDLPVLPVLSAP